jgi:hypothetical protein
MFQKCGNERQGQTMAGFGCAKFFLQGAECCGFTEPSKLDIIGTAYLSYMLTELKPHQQPVSSSKAGMKLLTQKGSLLLFKSKSWRKTDWPVFFHY